MPNRIIREGILTSPRMAKLGWPEEVFYRRLLSVVDDFGRYYADHGMLRAACYPRQLSKVSDSDIGKWLQLIADAALVRVYTVESERYLEVADFGQQVRAKRSKFPDVSGSCVADAQQAPANAHLDVSVSVSVSEDVKPARKRALPADFAISPRVSEWAKEKGHAPWDCDQQFEAFVSYAKRKGATYVDWDEALMTAIREDWAKVRNRQADIARVTVPADPASFNRTREAPMTPEQREAADKARKLAMSALKVVAK